MKNFFLIIAISSSAFGSLNDLIDKAKHGQISAVDKIGAMKHEGQPASSVLIDLALGENIQLRIHAIKALGEIGSVDAIPILRSLGDPKVRPAVKVALSSLEKIPLTDEQKEWVKHAMEYAVVDGNIVKLPSNIHRGPRIEVGIINLVISAKVLAVDDKRLICEIDDGVMLPVLVRGFSTDGLVDGKDWTPNAEILIVGVERPKGVSIFTAIPYDLAKRGISFNDWSHR